MPGKNSTATDRKGSGKGLYEYNFFALLLCGLFAFVTSFYNDIILSDRILDVIPLVALLVCAGLLIKTFLLYPEIKLRFSKMRAGRQRGLYKRPLLFLLLLGIVEFLALYYLALDAVPIAYTKFFGQPAREVIILERTEWERRRRLLCPRIFVLADYPATHSWICAWDEQLWKAIRFRQRGDNNCQLIAVGDKSAFGLVPYRFERIESPSSAPAPRNC